MENTMQNKWNRFGLGLLMGLGLGLQISGPAAAQEALVGQIQIFSYANALCPRNTFLPLGQKLQISKYQALYSLLRNQYGGDGSSSFNLPNMNKRDQHGRMTGVGLPSGVYYCIVYNGIYPQP
jgi:hypothetical protein